MNESCLRRRNRKKKNPAKNVSNAKMQFAKSFDGKTESNRKVGLNKSCPPPIPTRLSGTQYANHDSGRVLFQSCSTPTESSEVNSTMPGVSDFQKVTSRMAAKHAIAASVSFRVRFITGLRPQSLSATYSTCIF